jgi:hypothetical protein
MQVSIRENDRTDLSLEARREKRGRCALAPAPVPSSLAVHLSAPARRHHLMAALAPHAPVGRLSLGDDKLCGRWQTHAFLHPPRYDGLPASILNRPTAV